MIKNPSDYVRKLMHLSNQEAHRFNHEERDIEHILMGMIKEGVNKGAIALKEANIDLRKIRLELEKLMESGPEMITMGKMPLTEKAKSACSLSTQKSQELRPNDKTVYGDAVLLALYETEGKAQTVLKLLEENPGDILEAVKAQIRFEDEELTLELVDEESSETDLLEEEGTNQGKTPQEVDDVLTEFTDAQRRENSKPLFEEKKTPNQKGVSTAIIGFLYSLGIDHAQAQQIMKECVKHPRKAEALISMLRTWDSEAEPAKDQIDQENEFAAICEQSMEKMDISLDEFMGFSFSNDFTRLSETIRTFFT